MASASENSTSRSRTNTKSGASKGTSRGSRKTSSSTKGRKASAKTSRRNVDIAVKNEVMLIVIFAAAIFVFLCITGLIHGAAATGISNAMFGVFGLLAYLIPIIIFVGFAFGISNRGNTVAIVKMVSGVILIFLLGIFAYMLMKQDEMLIGESVVKELYQTSVEHHAGGGVLFGSIAHGMYNLMGFGGTLFVAVVLGIICIVFITEKSFLTGVKKGGAYLYESAKEDAARMREYRESLREEYDDYEEDDAYEEDDEPVYEERVRSERPRYEERVRPKRSKPVKSAKAEKIELPKENVKRMDKRARGVMSSAAITFKPEKSQDIHEIVLLDDEMAVADADSFEEIKARPYNETVYSELANAEEQYADDTANMEQYSENNYNETAYNESIFDEVLDCENTNRFYNSEIAYGEMGNEEIGTDETIADEVMDNELEDDVISSTTDYFVDNPGVTANRSFWDEFDTAEHDAEAIERMPEPMTEDTVIPQPVEEKAAKTDRTEIQQEEIKIQEHVAKTVEEAPKPYMFPPLNLLKKGDGRKGDSANQLKETALHLQQTLQTFGVRVTITDISQGPSVTRYEMQPEQGVKVSKIVGLTDDIKLNLAATDIRIEAPIPGKAAVGIEVPNKETSAVALRDLLEAEAFQKFSSNLAFAVGKDIAGQVVVTDIAKMPHVLIAGATGSGKSVCINTIIMSILYKANPADVKLIMIDPKVVELSVYNGIPHLMIPVVTDPKKASAALNWGVTEMNDRYRKFADLNVRDLKGYNKAAEQGKTTPDGEPLQKLPQIVIIVDELADLMMVASGEVEESICRLAQLARACGIHLVIATQRPSVDVITGLIKANMPSRIAFSVSSGVDSRTILDMNGAEKLLGKGDMLFYPQGYTKPARVQGAFVSDSEVSDVVDFLKNQMLGNPTYNSEIEEKIKTMQSSSGAAGSSGAGNGSDTDVYFAEAAKFVIEKDKASIGMLQRVFKIGFNRAARIVDQLEEAGVVGAEEGTKPRRILMSMEQFQNYMEEHM
ncbi:MAG: DNA translocase FtsK [Lachnospiraceae bacterium]|nr:DNA translocase FtsK [Lachnospiraceae bacterium]